MKYQLIVGLFLAFISGQAFATIHEPIMTADDLIYRLDEDRTLELEFDRPTTVFLRTWHTDIPGDKFQILATLPSGKKMKSDVSAKPTLQIPEAGKVQFEFVSDEPAIHFTLFTEKTPKENEFDSCGPTPRDLFLKHFKKEWQWHELNLINSFREEDPKTFMFIFGNGTAPVRQEFVLGGFLETKSGYILQMTKNEFNYSDRYPYRNVLFFNKSGDVVADIPGVLYQPDSDGNFFISLTSKDKNNPFPKPEEIAKVTQEGKILWQGPIHGVQPTSLLLESASGHLVIPWNAPSHLGSYPINSPIIERKTGKQTSQDSIIDWSDVCSERNMPGDCKNQESEVKARLRQFWVAYMKENHYQENESGQACHPQEYFCYNLHLIGWKKLKAQFIIQTSITHRRDSGSGADNFVLLADGNKITRIPGAFYRTINDQLLISTALDSDFSSGTAWYSTIEKLGLFNEHGLKLWENELFGGPMFIKGPFQNQFSNGVLLKDNKLFWMSLPSPQSYDVLYRMIDLTTGKKLEEPNRKVGVGLCR